MAQYEVSEQIVSILINPKTRELIEVSRYGNDSVELYYPGGEKISGRAYFDRHETFSYDGDDYIRSHSPSANVKKGSGYGVVLYAGLSLRAFSDTSAMGIASSDGGTGHSGRSADADAFWARCVENDLAEEDYISNEESREYEMYASDYFTSGCDDVPDEDCTDVTDVSGDITITYDASGGEIEAQFMSAYKVSEAGLIFALPGMKTELEFDVPTPEVLVSLDLQHCHDVGLAELLISHAMDAGFDQAYVERLVSTLPSDVYRKTSISRQLRFDFVPNASKTRIKQEIEQVWRKAYGGLASI